MSSILIADDDPEVRRFLVRIVKRKFPGTKITTAIDGLEALQHLLGDSFDLGVIGQRMKKLNGLQVMRLIRRKDQFTNLVMLSDLPTGSIARQASIAGFQDFMEKPIVLRRVLNVLQRYLVMDVKQKSTKRATDVIKREERRDKID